ncbi:MAG: hypothetical protein JXA18_13865, partial [Chitinispirillaceae bacterium]|nr:hypothetical protein [Chitinispirillaceae bacterium]
VFGPRKADGSLPDVKFMHLSANSKLIDKGKDVGLPFTGSAPDLGAFEYKDPTPVIMAIPSQKTLQSTIGVEGLFNGYGYSLYDLSGRRIPCGSSEKAYTILVREGITPAGSRHASTDLYVR